MSTIPEALSIALEHHRAGHLPRAEAIYQQILAADANQPDALHMLGVVAHQRGNHELAIDYIQAALQRRASDGVFYNNLGEAFRALRMLPEAIACYQRAVQLKPAAAEPHSNLVYTLHFSPECDARQIFQAARRWNQQHAEPLARSIAPHANDRTPDRRLRVGYVSPDFHMHPVGRFLLPLLEWHDRAKFEIFCYSSVRAPDMFTDCCRARADVWRDVTAASDEKLAEQVRQDRIDILVDLTMHMADNRLLLFARKPAPVQVTYLAYCGTTGLSTIDYRLTDPYLDPFGQNDESYSEQSLRLPETYWCYRPPADAPPVNALPAVREGYVTFGCLNSFSKVSDAALAAWARLLQTTPSSRLLLHAHAGSNRDRVQDFFRRHGIAADRLSFVGRVPWEDYFWQYGQIDIALDPFPYCGGTTTCDALWMGVPVVSLAGQTAVGRAGLSILSNAGMATLVAHDVEQYVQIATALAADRKNLAALRATLRERLRRSPLMDARRFARNVEAVYSSIWRRWCVGDLRAWDKS
jgi:protein O-GlcNAc transferase